MASPASADAPPSYEESKAPAVPQPTLAVVGQSPAGPISAPENHVAPPASNSAVITQQPRVSPGMKPDNYVVRLTDLGETPNYINCPHCLSRQKTKIEHQTTSETMVAAVFCCCCCGILPMVIPFLCHWCSDTEHFCEGCGKRVAIRSHNGGVEPFLPPQTTAGAAQLNKA